MQGFPFRTILTSLFFSILFISCQQNTKQKGKFLHAAKQLKNDTTSEESTTQSDATPYATVIYFMNWYEKHADSLNQKELVMRTSNPKKVPDYCYRINFSKTEKYLNGLRSSQCLSDSFLLQLHQYFKLIDEDYQKNPEKAGSPNGMDYDLITYTVNPHTAIKDLLKGGKDIMQNNGHTIVKLYYPETVYGLLFRLSKTGNKWYIDAIDQGPFKD